MIDRLLNRLRRAGHRPVSEATAARQRAEADLERIRSETPHYAALGNSLRSIREANHLTELFYSNRHPGGDA